MNTLEAPDFMGRREAAERLIAALPDHVDEVTLVFGDEQYTTTSFIDEFVRQVLDLGRAQTLRFVGADAFTLELIEEAVEYYNVRDRVIIEPGV